MKKGGLVKRENIWRCKSEKSKDRNLRKRKDKKSSNKEEG